MSASRADHEHPPPPASGQEPIHEVTWWGNLVAALVNRAPRAKCGASLEGEPDTQIPLCPECAAR